MCGHPSCPHGCALCPLKCVLCLLCSPAPLRRSCTPSLTRPSKRARTTSESTARCCPPNPWVSVGPAWAPARTHRWGCRLHRSHLTVTWLRVPKTPDLSLGSTAPTMPATACFERASVSAKTRLQQSPLLSFGGTSWGLTTCRPSLPLPRRWMRHSTRVRYVGVQMLLAVTVSVVFVVVVVMLYP
jgi:hypothetical protein